MNLQQIFIQNLKKSRKKLRLSQMQLAMRCAVSTNYISLIESGARFPSVGMVERLADALRVQPYTLFFNGQIEKTMPIIPPNIKTDILKQVGKIINQY